MDLLNMKNRQQIHEFYKKVQYRKFFLKLNKNTNQLITYYILLLGLEKHRR